MEEEDVPLQEEEDDAAVEAARHQGVTKRQRREVWLDLGCDLGCLIGICVAMVQRDMTCVATCAALPVPAPLLRAANHALYMCLQPRRLHARLCTRVM